MRPALHRPLLRPRLSVPCRTHAEQKNGTCSIPLPAAPRAAPLAVPGAVQPALHFYNVPVSVDPASPANPLNIIRKIYRPGDFIVSYYWFLARGLAASRQLSSHCSPAASFFFSCSCSFWGMRHRSPACSRARLGGQLVAVWG